MQNRLSNHASPQQREWDKTAQVGELARHHLQKIPKRYMLGSSSKTHIAPEIVHKQGGICLRTMYRKLPRFGNLPSAVAAPLLQQLPNRTAVLAAARKVGQQLCCASNTPEHLSDHAEFTPACCRTLGHLTQHSTECKAERRQKHLPEHKLQHEI